MRSLCVEYQERLRKSFPVLVHRSHDLPGVYLGQRTLVQPRAWPEWADTVGGVGENFQTSWSYVSVLVRKKWIYVSCFGDIWLGGTLYHSPVPSTRPFWNPAKPLFTVWHHQICSNKKCHRSAIGWNDLSHKHTVFQHNRPRFWPITACLQGCSHGGSQAMKPTQITSAVVGSIKGSIILAVVVPLQWHHMRHHMIS